MAVEKIIEEFRKENPEFPEYILDELLELIPSKTNDSKLKEILKNVVEEYENSLISPNEAIGVIAAQSVGAEATQMTLNTFHFAGVSSHSVQGLPRLIEILDAKKNLESSFMKVYLKKEGMNDEKFKLVADKIKETKLIEFAKNVDVDLDEKLIKIQLDLDKLSRFNIEPESIVSYIDKKIRKKSSLEGDELLIKEGNNVGLKDLIASKEYALNSIVYGIKGIKDVSLIREEDDYLIITKGVSLKQVINIEEVDVSRIYSNDIIEMYNYLGIEAARQVIINEIVDVVKSQGLSINERHILLLADIMTQTGEVKGMTRYGIVADKLNVLTRASFETPLKHLSKGALMNEENPLSSVTENVMTNQIVNVGTGLPKISVKKKD